MIDEKLIVIGCDDTVILSTVLDCLKKMPFFSQNIISASRSLDLLSLVKTLNPDLVILSFRNTQSVLNEVGVLVETMATPVFCLTRKWEDQNLSWDPGCIVFTCPLDQAGHQECLSSTINSIFLLRPVSLSNRGVGAFAESARRESQQAAQSRYTSPLTDQPRHLSPTPDQSRHLSRYVMELDQKVEVLSKVKDRIAELYPRVDDRVRAELVSIVNAIKMSANDTKLWDDFKVYFEETNPGFLSLLSRNYPELTPIDLKYCCYLKMNMSNDDIRNLLGINQESVRTHKYRLKRKMSLSKEQDLNGFLHSVG